MQRIFLILITLLSQNSFAYRDVNPCVENVVESMKHLKRNGSDLRVRNNKIIKGRKYTMGLFNKFGIDNHFQGIQRLFNSEYFVFSGGDYARKQGHLFIGKIESKSGAELWGENRIPWKKTPKKDKLISKIKVGSKLWWHPGGLQTLGGILVVPSEDYKVTNTAIIEFFDMSRPQRPVKFKHSIIRKHQDAGGVAITKLENGYYLLGVHATPEIDFYLSKSMRFEDGFDSKKFMSWNKNNVQQNAGFTQEFGGSSMNFIKQCDGELFIATFNNSSKAAPIIKGKDWMSLYQIDFKDDLSAVSAVTKVAEKSFTCKGRCNFAAGVGVYITPSKQLHVYSINHFRNFWGSHIKFREF